MDREKAYALYASSGNLTQVHEQTGIPISTIKTWIDNEDKSTEIAKLRNEKKAEFAEACWKPITIGVELIEREMLTARDKQAELEQLIDMINDSDEMSYKAKQDAIKNISRIARPDMRELTTAIGTLYDKQALAVGDSTANESIKIELAEELKEYAE